MPVEKIEAVSIAVIKGDCLLLVRRGNAPARGLYAFPGGRVDPGETAQNAAQRELLEETGITASNLQFFREILLPSEKKGEPQQFRLKVFVAHYADGTPQAADDAVDAAWFGIEAMRALPITESTLAIGEEILAARKAGLRLSAKIERD